MTEVLPPPTSVIVRHDFVPRVRGLVGERVVLDSQRAILVSEPGKAVAILAVPLADIDRTYLIETPDHPSELHPGTTRGWDLLVDGERRRAAAWAYEVDGLEGLVGVRFDALDRWLEEDEEVVIHPRSSRHRVDAIASDRHVVVRLNGTILAETHRPVAVFETGHATRWYIPAADLRHDHLTDVDLHTGCPYKGTASYFAHRAAPDRAIAWYYPDPLDEVAAIEGHVAFFDELIDIEVDGARRDRPVTQWSHGLRDNLRGGGSGRHQATSSPHDHPSTTHSTEETSVTVTDLDATGALSRRHPVPPGEFTYEPSERRVRGTIGETAVVDSYAPVLVWEPGQAVPGYVFPRNDVRVDLLEPTTAPEKSRDSHVKQWYDLHIDGTVYEALVWEYDVEGLGDHLAVDWFRRSAPGVEHWYEEAEEIFRHPRDPYKRVDAIQSSRHVEVLIDGVKVADTTRPVLLFETRLPVRYYIPAEDVDFSHLRETDLSSTCPYKGDARYWSFVNEDDVRDNIVWSYPTPIRAAQPITDLIAFYNEVVDIIVDGVALDRPESEFTAALATAK